MNTRTLFSNPSSTPLINAGLLLSLLQHPQHNGWKDETIQHYGGHFTENYCAYDSVQKAVTSKLTSLHGKLSSPVIVSCLL
jgi:hypothetical protein